MALHLLLLLMGFATTMAPPANSRTLQATVLSIGDGDSLQVWQAGRALKVRLACIDAPELQQSPWGAQSRSRLQQRLPVGREVKLDVKDTDRHGRAVAEVTSDINIGLVLVEEGQAFVSQRHLHHCKARQYQAAEGHARRRRMGVWQVSGGITRPWIFRHRRGHARSILTSIPSSPG
jgi:endonuclease YncB( thermonuclease family)